MPRPPSGELTSASSPYSAPPGTLAPAAGTAPLSYAGQPLPPAPVAKAVPTPAGLFNAFKRRWVLGTFVGLAAAAAAAVLVWLVLPGGKHEARALVNLRDRNADLAFKNVEDYESYRRNQIFILKTRDLLTRTVNDPAVASLDMVKAADDPVRLLEESVAVSVAAPQVLAVTIKGNNIEEMKTIVDALTKRYVDDATEADRRDREAQAKKLEKLELNLKEEAESLERQIKLISRGTGATGGESQEKRLAGLQQRLSELEAEIAQVGRDVGRAEADRDVARKQLAENRPPLELLAVGRAISTDPRLIKLSDARDELAKRLAREKDRATDPDTSEVVLELKAELAKADREYDAKRKTVIAEVEEAERAKGMLGLQSRIIELESRIASLNGYREKQKFDRDTLQKTLAGGAESNFEVTSLLLGLVPQREAISKIRNQLVQLRIQKDLDNRASIREPAQPLPNNNLAKKLILGGGAGLGTFAVVVLLVAFLEWRTRRVDGVDQVVGELGMRIIGTVPAFPNRARLKAAAEAGGGNWRFALNEAINSTRTMLLHSARAQSMQVVMVTSAMQGEGKTSIASQLGTSMATAGMRTLVVDCDLRNPSIHKLFDAALSPGVSEILTQVADVSEAIQPTAVPNLWVVPAGLCSARVIAALAQGHPLETLFNRLRGQFDFVIVDSCPVLPVADALLIGQHVDGVVFSIMQDISQLPKVMTATEKLNQLSIPLIGAVVNGIKQDVYSYGYNYVKQLPA